MFLELDRIRLVVETGHLKEFEFVELVTRVRYAFLVDREYALLSWASNIAHILVIEAGTVIKLTEQWDELTIPLILQVDWTLDAQRIGQFADCSNALTLVLIEVLDLGLQLLDFLGCVFVILLDFHS